MRRTTRRPVTWSVAFLEVNAVKGTSATSAFEIHRPVTSSRIAFGYSIVSHPSSGIVAIAVFTAGSIRTVMDTSAPALIAVPMVAWHYCDIRPNLPPLKSAMAWMISCWLFITNGP